MNDESAKDQVEQARTVLAEILKIMGFEGKISAFKDREKDVMLHIESPDAARLIGRGAQVLNALQLVVTRIVSRGHEQSIHCTVDVEHYRDRRRDKLTQMALDAADKVHQDGRPVRLPEMGAADRRVIHQLLKDQPDIVTHSEVTGEKDEKRVVVSLKASAAGAGEEGAGEPVDQGQPSIPDAPPSTP